VELLITELLIAELLASELLASELLASELFGAELLTSALVETLLRLDASELLESDGLVEGLLPPPPLPPQAVSVIAAAKLITNWECFIYFYLCNIAGYIF